MSNWKEPFLRGKDIKETLQELSDHIDVIQKDKEYYKEKYFETRDEKFKDEEVKKLKEELDYYKHNSLIILSDKQKEQVKEFNSKHYNSCRCNSVKYILTPTGMGMGVDIECPICGEKLDITDYDLW